MKSEYMILYTSVIPNSNRTSIILCDQRLKQKTKKLWLFHCKIWFPKGCMTWVDCCARKISFSLSLPFRLFCDNGDHLASLPEHVAGFDVRFTPKHWPKSFASGSWRSGILHKMPLNSSIVMFIQVFERRLRARHSLTWWGPLKPWGFTEIGVPTCLMTFRFGMSKYLQLSLEYSYHDACSWWSLSL